jgi:hypothetical protein
VKADQTRRSFDPIKHFSRVLMQQGRVQLDADWNEQAAITLHLVRRLAAHVFPSGGGSGFGITALGTNVLDDFTIGAGDFWVDGILCELESTPIGVLSLDVANKRIVVAAWTVDEMPFAVGQYVLVSGLDSSGTAVEVTAQITALAYGTSTLTLDTDISALQGATNLRVRRLVTYTSQPGGLPDSQQLQSGNSYQIYLDVWERLITCLEDNSIREVALNGPDTAARTQVVWQIRALKLAAAVGRPTKGKLPVQPAAQCMTLAALTGALHPAVSGLLQARAVPALESTDPCTISPDSQYRGPENQLYRVEVHAGRLPPGDQAPAATFKWSRENGSVVFPILKLDISGAATEIVLGSLGRDDRFGLQIGDYVEIQDDRSVLANTVAPLLQVQSIDRTAMLVTLTGNAAGTTGTDSTLHPLLRRWDQKATTTGGIVLDGGAVRIVGDVWLDLEDGVQVRFPNGDAASYTSGDYWLIPARVATGNVIWPTETGTDVLGAVTVNPVSKPPDGVAHHYLPLAIFNVTGSAPEITSCVVS